MKQIHSGYEVIGKTDLYFSVPIIGGVIQLYPQVLSYLSGTTGFLLLLKEKCPFIYLKNM